MALLRAFNSCNVIIHSLKQASVVSQDRLVNAMKSMRQFGNVRKNLTQELNF